VYNMKIFVQFKMDAHYLIQLNVIQPGLALKMTNLVHQNLKILFYQIVVIFKNQFFVKIQPVLKTFLNVKLKVCAQLLLHTNV
jgi:hypothetical protein